MEEEAVLEAEDLIVVTRDPGNEPWNCKEQGKHGSSALWEPATSDQETVTFDQSISNASPDWDTKYRPGDSKRAASVLTQRDWRQDQAKILPCCSCPACRHAGFKINRFAGTVRNRRRRKIT